MKKLILLVVALAFLGAVPVFAEEELTDMKYNIINESDEKVATLIPTTLLIPRKCRVIRVTFSNIQGTDGAGVSSEVYGGLYDSPTVGEADAKNSEGEIESADSDSVSIPYDRPLMISNGCVILQGANTSALVEWDRISP